MLLAEARLLRDLVADPGYGGRVVGVIQRVVTAASPADVLDLLFSATQAMGADYAGFVTYIRDDCSHENFRFVLACDPRWCFEYQAKAAYSMDPWILYASANTEPTCASRIPARTSAQREVQALAVKYGMVSTCVAPAPSSGALSRVGMLAVGSRRAGFFEGEGFDEFQVLARSLAMELQGWWVRRLRKELIDSRGITDDDLTLLALERAGLGTKQIAAELGTTTASVDSRWQRLNRKLGTPNRQASAKLAAEYGLI